MSQNYAVLCYVNDKHPELPPYQGGYFNAEADAYWFTVMITEGYTTLDKETVTNILTIAHGARLEIMNPLIARKILPDGGVDMNHAIWL